MPTCPLRQSVDFDLPSNIGRIWQRRKRRKTGRRFCKTRRLPGRTLVTQTYRRPSPVKSSFDMLVPVTCKSNKLKDLLCFNILHPGQHSSDHFELAGRLNWRHWSSGTSRCTQDQLDSDHFGLEGELKWSQRSSGTGRGTQDQLDSDHFELRVQQDRIRRSSGPV